MMTTDSLNSQPESKRPNNTKGKKVVESLNLEPVNKPVGEPTFDNETEEIEQFLQPQEVVTHEYDTFNVDSQWVRVKDLGLNLAHVTSVFVKDEELVVILMGNMTQKYSFGSKEMAENILEKILVLVQAKSLDKV